MLLRKLNIAINLLTNTDLKISDISQSAGFTDSAYFCLKFKEMMNDTRWPSVTKSEAPMP